MKKIRDCKTEETQKIWLAICEFRWSLTNQNAWFVISFRTELTLFCTVEKKTALLLTNQNGEIFSCILLSQKKKKKVLFYMLYYPLKVN